MHSKHRLGQDLAGEQADYVVCLGNRCCNIAHNVGDLYDARIGRLERLLLGTLGFGRDFEALFGRVENVLDLLEQALVFLELGVRLHGLLDQQLDVAQLAEVEVAFAFQARDRLLQLRVLLPQRSAGGAASSRGERCACPRCGRVAGGGRSAGSGGGGARCCTARGGEATLALSARDGVVVVAGEVLVPVLLDELEKLEVVLHLALYQRLDPDGLVDLVLGECVCGGQLQREGAGGEHVLCNILKFCRYAYSVLALNLTRAMGTSSAAVSHRHGPLDVAATHRRYCQTPGTALPWSAG
jgi:hypothetical protein